MNIKMNAHDIACMYGYIQSILPTNNSNKLLPDPISIASTFTMADPIICISSQTALMMTLSKTDMAETNGIRPNPATASATVPNPPKRLSKIPKIAEKIFPIGENHPFLQKDFYIKLSKKASVCNGFQALAFLYNL